MGLSEFSDGKSFLEAVGAMDTAFCDKFDFYVYSDSFDIIPLDEFIRCVKADETYYVGGTLKYDY